MITDDNNKRSFYRVNLSTRMCGEISIYKVKNKKVRSNKSYICIENISAGGVRLRSKLLLPKEDVIYRISFELYGERFDIQAKMQWRYKEGNSYIYGAKFQTSNERKEELASYLSLLEVKVKISSKNLYSICNKRCYEINTNNVS